ncbi:MAG: D-2-hydroxyacid dehydrogenase, partial [Alphaproteobacteria bacterium]
MRRRPFQIHLENFTSKPLIFHLTPDLIAALRARHPGADGLARFTHGENLVGLAGRLRETEVLVTSTDVLRHADFPKRDLAAAAPRLRLIHLIGAGIEGAMPLDWLPPGTVLTNNSGVHAAKIGEFFLMALVALNNRLPAMVTNQRAAR